MLVLQPTTTKGNTVNVWILTKGEDGAGGTVEGVFVTEPAGERAYLKAVSGMPFGVEEMSETRGSVSSGTVVYEARGGCDWVRLAMYVAS